MIEMEIFTVLSTRDTGGALIIRDTSGYEHRVSGYDRNGVSYGEISVGDYVELEYQRQTVTAWTLLRKA